jgi:hypothetical protein
MDASHWEKIKIQIDIVALHNQQIGSYEFDQALRPNSKVVQQKLRAAKSDAHNQTTILKNMIRDYSGGVVRTGNLAELMRDN